MNSIFKNVWLIAVLFIAGVSALIFSLTAKPTQQVSDVELNPIFNQTSTVAQPSAQAQDPIPSPAIVEDSDSGKATGYAVQVYSFQDKKRAEAALANLHNKGYKAFIVMSDLGEKGTWYRVRVGGIESEVDAQRMLEEIRKEYKSGFIVKPTV